MADKILEAQKDVRLKAMQAQEFFKDLESWEETVAKKDKQLQKTSTVKKKNLPPVRSQQPPAAATATATATTTAPAQSSQQSATPQAAAAETAAAKAKRIKSGDYRAWDRFDVDAQLAELEAEEQRAAAAEAYKGAADVPEDASSFDDHSLRNHMAAVEKENGNEQFKKGKFAAAVDCYTRGLESCPEHAVLLANRAMALLKLKRYGEARDDAARAIALDPKYVKAYSRRATACSSLGEFDQAIRDWEAIARLEPKNKKARTEIKDLKKRQEEAQAEKHRSFNPLRAAESLTRQKRAAEKPLIRIPIHEVGEARDDAFDDGTADESKDEGKSRSAEKPGKSQAAEKIAMISEMDASEAAAATKGGRTPSPPAAAQAHAAPPKISEVSIVDKDGANASGVSADTVAAGKAASAAASKAASAAAPKTKASPAAAQPQAARRAPTASLKAQDSSAVTAYVFETTWQRLREDNPAALARFLEGIEAKRLPDYMSHAFDAQMLTTMLTLLRDYFIADGVRVAPVMRQLMKVPRFDVVVMFLDDHEKQPARDLIAALEKGATPDPQVKDKTLALFKQAYDV